MANILNQIVDQGATYSRQITVLENDGITLQNLTDWTVTAQVRKNYTSTNYTTINATKVEPQTSGKITMSLTAVETAGMKAGRYVYDLEIKKSNEVRRIIEGVITIRPEVTRPEV